MFEHENDDVINDQALTSEQLKEAVKHFNEKLAAPKQEPSIEVAAVAEATKPDLGAAVESFKKAFRDRTYSGRHADEGRMFKCPVCCRRHRGTQCEQRFTTTIAHSKETVEPRIAPVPRLLRITGSQHGWRRTFDKSALIDHAIHFPQTPGEPAVKLAIGFILEKVEEWKKSLSRISMTRRATMRELRALVND